MSITTYLDSGHRIRSADPNNPDQSRVELGGMHGVADIVASRCKEVMDAQEVIKSLFWHTGRSGVELHDFRPATDFTKLPKLQIYPSVVDEEEAPQQTSNVTVQLGFGLRFGIDKAHQWKPRDPWEPGVESHIHVVQQVLRDPRNRLWPHMDFWVRRDGETTDRCVQIGRGGGGSVAKNIRVDRDTDRDRYAVTYEFAWEWLVRLHRPSGLPHDLAVALGIA